MQLPEESPRKTDADALAELLKEWSAKLERIAWSILRDWPLAADAVQETYVLLAQRLAGIPPEQRPGWLVKTVQFQAQNIRRKQQRANQLPEKLLASGYLRESQSGRTDSRRTQSGKYSAGNAVGDAHEETFKHTVEHAEDLRRMWAAIDMLPETQRVIVLGRLGEDKTFAQLADELQLPLGTVLSRMRLALEKLRTKLNDT